MHEFGAEEIRPQLLLLLLGPELLLGVVFFLILVFNS
jgi:hypothetical protein